MSSEPNSITWPSESVLVQRAERSLNIVRAPLEGQRVEVPFVQAIESMEAHLRLLEQGPGQLVPTGFESAGSLSFLKQFMKKVTRRLVWWYVEPRWTVQQQLTQELAAFARASVQANLALSLELDALRLQVDDLQAGQQARAT